MRVSTHNGLEVWLESRSHPHSRAKNEEKSEIPPVSDVPQWERMAERPPRIDSQKGELIITGSLDIDLHSHVSFNTAPDYRLAIKQASYHDWAGDLRVVMKGKAGEILKTGYLMPGIDQITYYDLDWSPYSCDELASILASTLPVGPDCVIDLPGVGVEGVVIDVNEEALNALSLLEDQTLEAGVSTTSDEAPGEDLRRNLSLTPHDHTGASEQQPIILLDNQPHISPPASLNDLEISFCRGLYTPLPASPPPPYMEKDIGTALYHGTVPLTFGEYNDEWTGNDPEGVAWCRFKYEVEYSDTKPATTDPYILNDEQADLLRVQLDQLARDLEQESIFEQRHLRKAAKRSLKEEERERRAQEEKERQDELDTTMMAVAVKEARRQAGMKGWQTRLDRGRVPAVKKESPVIRRLIDQERQLAPKRPQEVLKLRPANSDGGDRDRHYQSGPKVSSPRRTNEDSSQLRRNPEKDENTPNTMKTKKRTDGPSADRSVFPREKGSEPAKSLGIPIPHRRDEARRDHREHRDDRDCQRDNRAERGTKCDTAKSIPCRQAPPSTSSIPKDPNSHQTKPYVDDDGRLHLVKFTSPSYANIDSSNDAAQDEGQVASRSSRSFRTPIASSRPPNRTPQSAVSSNQRGLVHRPGPRRTDTPEHYGLTRVHRGLSRAAQERANHLASSIVHGGLPRLKREVNVNRHAERRIGYHDIPRVKRERERERDASEEESEEDRPPMDEQKRAYWEREQERKVKRRKMEEKEERRRIRRLAAKEDVRVRGLREVDEDWIAPDSSYRREKANYRLDRVKLEAVGQVVDMTELSD